MVARQRLAHFCIVASIPIVKILLQLRRWNDGGVYIILIHQQDFDKKFSVIRLIFRFSSSIIAKGYPPAFLCQPARRSRIDHPLSRPFLQGLDGGWRPH